MYSLRPELLKLYRERICNIYHKNSNIEALSQPRSYLGTPFSTNFFLYRQLFFICYKVRKTWLATENAFKSFNRLAYEVRLIIVAETCRPHPTSTDNKKVLAFKHGQDRSSIIPMYYLTSINCQSAQSSKPFQSQEISQLEASRADEQISPRHNLGRLLILYCTLIYSSILRQSSEQHRCLGLPVYLGRYGRISKIIPSYSSLWPARTPDCCKVKSLSYVCKSFLRVMTRRLSAHEYTTLVFGLVFGLNRHSLSQHIRQPICHCVSSYLISQTLI